MAARRGAALAVVEEPRAGPSLVLPETCPACASGVEREIWHPAYENRPEEFTVEFRCGAVIKRAAMDRVNVSAGCRHAVLKRLTNE